MNPSNPAQGAVKRVLVTGAAGFIGFHVTARLIAAGCEVLGLDDLNPYYDPKLKAARLQQLAGRNAFSFERLDIAEHAALAAQFARFRPDAVVHLAAQAGVRYSLENPRAYARANLDGFLSMLEACRHHPVRHLVYASSSSVYGASTKAPFSEHEPADHPVSLYAATKRANELMAHAYAHLFAIPATALRFFTVYGPWGRPDMALLEVHRGDPRGEPDRRLRRRQATSRDFTYVDDIVEGDRPAWSILPPSADPAWSTGPGRIRRRRRRRWRIYNIGNSHAGEARCRFIAIDRERDSAGRRSAASCRCQPGDVPMRTAADVTDLAAATGFAPSTPLETGILRFVAWYRDYYRM
jgi:UDP-glucuronate 4-epimerase